MRRQAPPAPRADRGSFLAWAGGLTLLYTLIAFAVRGSGFRAYARRNPSGRVADPAIVPPLPLLPWILLAFGWVPVAVAGAWWLSDPEPLTGALGSRAAPFTPWLAGGLFYFSLSALGAQRHLRTSRAALAQGGDPFALYKRFREAQAGLGIGMILCPLFYIPYFIYTKRKASALRTQPRRCADCGEALARLGEREDDDQLEKGQQLEEELGSVDYDAWYCAAGGHVLVLPYPRSSKYSRCEACGYATSGVTRSWTVASPTYDNSGEGAQSHECRHCGRTKRTSYSIPRLVRSTSSASSGSRSGGSFGGGRSGGGGSGGSW